MKTKEGDFRERYIDFTNEKNNISLGGLDETKTKIKVQSGSIVYIQWYPGYPGSKRVVVAIGRHSPRGVYVAALWRCSEKLQSPKDCQVMMSEIATLVLDRKFFFFDIVKTKIEYFL